MTSRPPRRPRTQGGATAEPVRALPEHTEVRETEPAVSPQRQTRHRDETAEGDVPAAVHGRASCGSVTRARRGAPVLRDHPRAMVANSATATADGTLELVPPGVLEMMFGPNIASNSTASQITEIASDAHISVIWSQANRCGPTARAESHSSRPPFLQASVPHGRSRASAKVLTTDTVHRGADRDGTKGGGEGSAPLVRDHRSCRFAFTLTTPGTSAIQRVRTSRSMVSLALAERPPHRPQLRSRAHRLQPQRASGDLVVDLDWISSSLDECPNEIRLITIPTRIPSRRTGGRLTPARASGARGGIAVVALDAHGGCGHRLGDTVSYELRPVGNLRAAGSAMNQVGSVRVSCSLNRRSRSGHADVPSLVHDRHSGDAAFDEHGRGFLERCRTRT